MARDADHPRPRRRRRASPRTCSSCTPARRSSTARSTRSSREPGHPYTQALMAAVPAARRRASRGAARRFPACCRAPDAIPPGCRFEPRCRLAGEREICRTERPGVRHPAIRALRVACHFTRGVPRDRGRDPTGRRSRWAAPAIGEDAARRRAIWRRTTAARGSSGRASAGSAPSTSVSLRRSASGESLGLVGESGSGKSTVARLLARPHAAAPAATVSFEGGRSRRRRGGIAKEQRGRVQMVFQDPGDSLDPLMTIERDRRRAAGPAHAARRGKRRGRVPELLELVGLEADYGKRRPLQLSGGQRQRVAIARALATDPALIVCDEAVSSLDVSVRAQILNLLMDLQRRLGLSYLFISHDLSTVRHVCDRVAVMYGGQFVEVADGRRDLHARRSIRTRSRCSRPFRFPIPCGERERRRIRLEGELPDLTQPVAGLHLRVALLEGAGALHRRASPVGRAGRDRAPQRLPLPGERRMSIRSALESRRPATTRRSRAIRSRSGSAFGDEAPLFHDTVDDVYLLTRYDDVTAVLRDDVTYSTWIYKSWFATVMGDTFAQYDGETACSRAGAGGAASGRSAARPAAPPSRRRGRGGRRGGPAGRSST